MLYIPYFQQMFYTYKNDNILTVTVDAPGECSMSLYDTVLLAVDIHGLNQKTIESAREIAYQNKAKLHIVYVVEPLPLFEHGFLGDVILLKQLRSDLNQQFNQLARDLEIPEDRRHFELGNAKKTILQVANKINSDCIVLASHSPQAMLGLLGSTASGVSQSAPCAVLITPGALEKMT